MMTTGKAQRVALDKAPCLESITALTAAARELDDLLRAGIDTARAANASWAEIGAALGTSRQSAHQKYGGAA